MLLIHSSISFFFFNDTATTEIYTLSLHDALPICCTTDLGVHMLDTCLHLLGEFDVKSVSAQTFAKFGPRGLGDRKSTRLNSSHGYISYAVFCLKKKKKPQQRAAQPHCTMRTATAS